MPKRKSLIQQWMDITIRPYFEFIRMLLDANEWVGEKHKKRKRRY